MRGGKKGVMSNLLSFLLFVVPKNLLSHWVGKLMHLSLPEPFRRWSLKWFIKKYHIDMSEAELDLLMYPNIGALFTRRLNPRLRPVIRESFAVHPCDARITTFGCVDAGVMVQAKNHNYTLTDFVGESELAAKLGNGFYLTYYLCPTDYHRVHSPVDGKVRKVIHLPGNLWPVNDWSVNRIERLFAVNERIVVELETERGILVLVMVGATNVGKMTLSFLPELVSNQAAATDPQRRVFLPQTELKKGDELGIFHMGSTVIMVFAEETASTSSFSATNAIKTGKVKMGQSLI